jgi:glyoxylase-like metal-dependent hydrolase (beta-lactamase superfamily II)
LSDVRTGRRGECAPSRSVGAFDVVALRDAAGPFPLARQAAFPGATQADWDRARRLDLDAFGPGDAWHLDFHCFAIRRPGDRITLVDAGVGPQGSPASSWAPVPGRLPEALTGAGIGVRDVDVVVLTHLHEDHIGWSVGPDGAPMFPRARYVVQHDEVVALVAGGDQTLLRYVVEPLRRSGQLHEVNGPARLAGRAGDRITVVPTPGHTPGHQSVLVEGDGKQIVITGDVLVHAVQLIDPAVGYRFESDQDLARGTRRALLAGARSRRALLATAHLTKPFVHALTLR